MDTELIKEILEILKNIQETRTIAPFWKDFLF